MNADKNKLGTIKLKSLRENLSLRIKRNRFTPHLLKDRNAEFKKYKIGVRWLRSDKATCC
jgi:hypothetical protein